MKNIECYTNKYVSSASIILNLDSSLCARQELLIFFLRLKDQLLEKAISLQPIEVGD